MGNEVTQSSVFSRHQPGGMISLVDVRRYPGNVFFVDASHAAASNTAGFGRNPDAPFATTQYAITQDLVSAGDTILVMPGHTENLTTATSINADIAGVTIEGVMHGNLMPTLSMTLLAGSITVAAANVTLRNLKLVANVTDGVTSAVTIAAAGDGCTLENILMRDTLSTKEFLIHVSVATTVTDLTIRKCSLVGLLGGSMSNSILFAGTSTDTLIEDNYIFVDSSDDVIDHLAGAGVNTVVRRNVIINADTDAAGYCVRYKSDGTGVVHDNRFGYNKVDAEIGVGAAAFWFNNYASNTIAESGLLDPATTHAIP